MNRSDMRTMFYNKINEVSSNTAFPETYVNSLLEEGWKNIWKFNNTKWEWLLEETKLNNIYTTTSNTSTGTSLYATATTNMSAAQYIYVTDGSVYERVKITTVATPVVLTSPGLSQSYASGNYIIGNHIVLPTDVIQLQSITADKIESGSNVAAFLHKTDERELDEKYPVITETGTPEFYVTHNGTLIIYPLPDAVWNFRVKYFKVPAVLADATDPVLPLQYHYHIVDYALSRAIKAPNYMYLAQFYYQSFINGVNLMRSENSCQVDHDLRMRLEDEL